jgi:hypothetical protein
LVLWAKIVVNNGTTNVRRSGTYVWNTDSSNTSNLVSTVEAAADGLRTWQITWNGATGVTNKSQTVYSSGGNRYQTNVAPDLPDFCEQNTVKT